MYRNANYRELCLTESEHKSFINYTYWDTNMCLDQEQCIKEKQANKNINK